MNRAEKVELLDQIEQWNDADEFSRCIEAIEAIPETERDYLLTVKLSRAYSNLAVLGDHGERGTDGEVDGKLIQHAIQLLETVRPQGEDDPYWNARMGYSCLMAYNSANMAYEYAKRWLALAPGDPDAQKLFRDCEEYLEEEKVMQIDLKEREKIIRLYNEGILEKILCKIDDWLGVNDNNEQHTPSILRTIIARNSPDVYLLLMYFAFKNLESPIDLTAKEIKALAFVLHWFNANKSQKGCAQEIFSRCREAINKNNIKMGLAYLMHDCKLLHIYSPSEVREFIKIKENRDWRIWQNIHAPARQFFDRIFRYKNSETKEMLLYAERKYLNTHFSNYDPARQDLWEEYNRPWDFDHIVAKNKIVGKWGPYREYDKIWLNSIGNIAAISYESNRSKNAGENYIEYHLNRDTLLYDDAVENLDCNLTKSDKASFDFARITYKRFCNIYTDIYEVIKPLLADTELTGTLKRRKDIIDAVTNHFTDAVVHFAARQGAERRRERRSAAERPHPAGNAAELQHRRQNPERQPGPGRYAV